ncbi:MAG: nucleoside-diphosphate kinase [Candidatus Kaiserbacteria bacterium]|nr:nucleoside-diphosphate kinase [Candidatus Kaiserbacteria bacterium]
MNKEKHLERTLVIIKPDGVQRVLVGEVIRRFERVGLKIVAMKMVRADAAMIERHYSLDPDWKRKAGEKMLRNKRGDAGVIDEKEAVAAGEPIVERLKRYMTAGPIVPMVLEGAYAIPLTRKLVGGTEPLSSDVGSIRGDFVLDSYALANGAQRSIRNIVHASSSVEEAEKEVALWFQSEDLLAYETVHEHILYDINFDNAVE